MLGIAVLMQVSVVEEGPCAVDLLVLPALRVLEGHVTERVERVKDHEGLPPTGMDLDDDVLGTERTLIEEGRQTEPRGPVADVEALDLGGRGGPGRAAVGQLADRELGRAHRVVGRVGDLHRELLAVGHVLHDGAALDRVLAVHDRLDVEVVDLERLEVGPRARTAADSERGATDEHDSDPTHA